VALADEPDCARLRAFCASLLGEAYFRTDNELVESSVKRRIAVEIDFAAIRRFDEAAIFAGPKS